MTAATPPCPRHAAWAVATPTLDLAEFPLSQPASLGQPPRTEPTGLDGIDPSDPMAGKLELAEEFRGIGDTEGAIDFLLD